MEENTDAVETYQAARKAERKAKAERERETETKRMNRRHACQRRLRQFAENQKQTREWVNFKDIMLLWPRLETETLADDGIRHKRALAKLWDALRAGEFYDGNRCHVFYANPERVSGPIFQKMTVERLEHLRNRDDALWCWIPFESYIRWMKKNNLPPPDDWVRRQEPKNSFLISSPPPELPDAPDAMIRQALGQAIQSKIIEGHKKPIRADVFEIVNNLLSQKKRTAGVTRINKIYQEPAFEPYRPRPGRPSKK